VPPCSQISGHNFVAHTVTNGRWACYARGMSGPVPLPPSPAPPARQLSRHALLASAGVLVSRVSGLVREMVFAALFGASREYDAFLMAFRIPNLLRDLLAEGALSQAFTKVFTQVDQRDGAAAAWAVANRVLTLLVLVLVGFCAAGMFWADGVVGALAPGFSAVEGKTELTVVLARVMFPFIVLVAVAAQLMGMLNARGEFRLPQAASSFFNVGSVVVGLLTAWWMAPEFMADTWAHWRDGSVIPATHGAAAGRAMVGMAVGVVVGGALQMLVQVRPLWAGGWRPALTWDPGHPRVREVLRLMAPAVVGAAAVQVNVALINSNYASMLGDRPLSWLSYAFRFMQFPIGMFGVAVASAAQPAFSRATANKEAPDMGALRSALRESLGLACFLCLPAAVGLALLGEPLIALIYEHGRFTAADTQATAAALSAYAWGLTGYAVIKVMQPALLALDDARTPMLVSLGSILVNLVANHLLVVVYGFGHVGLAWSTSSVALVNALVLAWVLRKRAGGMDGAVLLRSVMTSVVAAAVMGLVVWALQHLWMRMLPDSAMLGHALRLVVGGVLGAGVFVGVARTLKAPEAAWLIQRLQRRGAGR
jgi:putative peptidoglycan lipid II flippase